MIKNGKFFVSPPKVELEFKELFKQLAAKGAGRPVDAHGSPEGPWTPELMANAISGIDANEDGIDLRTVQLWFQENDKGISTDNIRWLAKIFGCDDPHATSGWQASLSSAQARLVARRKQKQSSDEQSSSVALPFDRSQDHAVANDRAAKQDSKNDQFSIAGWSVAVFSNPNFLTLPGILWAGCTALVIFAFVAGVEDVTYVPVAGIEKQVGILWAPSWTLGPVLILPIFLILIVDLLNDWKTVRRTELERAVSESPATTWEAKVRSYSFLFWTVFVVSFGFLFVLQWSGVYLRALLTGEASNYMIDWNLVALFRPEVISSAEAIPLSMFGYLFFASLMWLLFAGLVILLIISSDFQDLCASRSLSKCDASRNAAIAFGCKIRQTIFRCTVLSLLFCICIKLQSTYLFSGAEDIVSWLFGDALSVLTGSGGLYPVLEQRGIPQFTTPVMLTLTCAVFLTCIMRVHTAFEKVFSGASVPNKDTAIAVRATKKTWWPMILVLAPLSANVFLIGSVPGFSIFLALTALVALHCLCIPGSGRA